MASKRYVAACLTYLSRTFAGKVDPEKAQAYSLALEDVTDAEIEDATKRLLSTHTGEFVPTPAVIRAAVPRLRAPSLNVARIERAIGSLGSHNPYSGWADPSVEVVRERLGDAIASAYATVGAGCLFADDAKTRDIARRDFVKAMEETVKAPGGRESLPEWATPTVLPIADRKRLTDGR